MAKEQKFRIRMRHETPYPTPCSPARTDVLLGNHRSPARTPALQSTRGDGMRDIRDSRASVSGKSAETGAEIPTRGAYERYTPRGRIKRMGERLHRACKIDMATGRNVAPRADRRSFQLSPAAIVQ